MLTASDVTRMDSLMAAILQRREDRGFNVPHRDEELIAGILGNAERRATREHQLYLSSKAEVNPTPTKGKEFPQLDRWRDFE